MSDSYGIEDYDDEKGDEAWCAEQRLRVIEYLKSQRLIHGRVGEWPAWHIAPYVSVWAIEDAQYSDAIGWWVISGDLPTDYTTAGPIYHPREGVRKIAQLWHDAVPYMLRGEHHPELKIGTVEDFPTIAPLLETRASILLRWADDDSYWPDP